MTVVIRRRDAPRQGVELHMVTEGRAFVHAESGWLFVRLPRRNGTPVGTYRCMRIGPIAVMGQISNFHNDIDVYPARVDIEWGLE